MTIESSRGGIFIVYINIMFVKGDYRYINRIPREGEFLLFLLAESTYRVLSLVHDHRKFAKGAFYGFILTESLEGLLSMFK